MSPAITSLPPIDHDLELWLSLAAQWLTAIGTIGAVVAALYFSRSDRRPRLNVSGAIVRAFPVGARMTYPEGRPFVNLTATIVGRVPIKVLFPCWSIGIFQHRRILSQSPPDNAPHPVELTNHGQQHILTFPAEQFFGGWLYMREEIRKYRLPRLAI